MPPVQPNRNGQSATPAEISIPGLTLATYSRSTDPAFAPRSITHKPRISSSSSKRKVDTTPVDDVKRPKSNHLPTSSRDVSTRGSQSPAPSVHSTPRLPTPKAVDPRIVPPSTNSPLKDINNRSNTHTPTGSGSQTPVQIPRSSIPPIESSSNHGPMSAAAITVPLSATVANHPVEQGEPPQILNAPKSDNPAEAALLAIFGRKRPLTSAVASPRPALSDTTAKSSEQEINTSQKAYNIQSMSTQTPSLDVLPSLPVVPSPPFHRQVNSTPPQTPVTVDTDSSSATIVDPPINTVIKTSWNQVTHLSDRVPAAHSLQSSASYRFNTENQTPPLTPATAPVTALANSAALVTPSMELGAVSDQSSPGSEPTIPPIPLDAIGTLQSVSADLFMVLGKGDISSNENQLFAAAGRMSACLQAHFVPYMDLWRADVRRPKAAMVMAPKGNDMATKAIQTITPIEPEAPRPQRISFSIPQPQTIVPILEKPDIPGYPLGVPPGRDVVEKQNNVQKHLSSAKVTINNQAKKLRAQAEELKRKDGVITRLQAKINQLEEENSILKLKAKPIETPLRGPSVGILSRGIEVQKKEIEYQKRQLEIKEAHNIRLRDLLQSNGIQNDLEDDIHEEGREREEERRSDRGKDDELDDGGARVTGEEKGDYRDNAGAEIDYDRGRNRDENDRTTPIRRPTTPTKVFSIRGHAQSPQAPMSNTKRAGGGLDKMATPMADFTDLVAEKASRRLSVTESTSHEPQITPHSTIAKNDEASDAMNPTRSDTRISSPARPDQTNPKHVGERSRRPTLSTQVGIRVESAAKSDQDPRSPWERSRADVKKIIPTGPRSDRPQTPPIGPVPPPIGPRLPVDTSRRNERGKGAYNSK